MLGFRLYRILLVPLGLNPASHSSKVPGSASVKAMEMSFLHCTTTTLLDFDFTKGTHYSPCLRKKIAGQIVFRHSLKEEPKVLMIMQSPVMASPLAVQPSSRTGPSSSGEQSGSHAPTSPMEGDVTSALPVLFGYRFLDASWWIVFGEQEVFQYTEEYEEHTTNSIDLLSTLSADMPGALIQSEVAVEALLEAGFVTAASSEDSMKHLRDWLLSEVFSVLGPFFGGENGLGQSTHGWIAWTCYTTVTGNILYNNRPMGGL
ncbi:hypothetical protein F5880DRAFT_1673654 [Lentinula raphanica]|nr:hypothetical protein F5880DRAFT_1673654 [Lentinula raphanica]